jgi:RND family efflux transporter MFP subunit
MRPWLQLPLLLCSALLLAACPRAAKHGPAAQPESPGPGAAVGALTVPVEVAKVRTGRVSSAAHSSGLFRGWRDITLSAEIGGTVARVLAQDGARVKDGQLLVELDHTQLDAQVESTRAQLDGARARLAMVQTATRPQQLAQAEAALAQAAAALELAKKQYARQQQLYEAGVISKAALDSAEAQLSQAQAAYDTAAEAVSLAKEGARKEDIQAAQAVVKQLEAALTLAEDQARKALIKAPFAGKVTQVLPKEHEMVAPGTPVLGLVDDSRMEVIVGVNAETVAKLEVGRKVTVRVEALDAEFAGKVEALGVKGDTDTGSFPIKLSVVNADRRILSGMTAEVTLPTVSHDNVIVLPREVVLFQQEGARVMVRSTEQPTGAAGQAQAGDVARSREIKLGLDAGAFVEVVQGLKVGEEVIVTGMKDVFDGTPIRVVATREMPLPETK